MLNIEHRDFYYNTKKIDESIIKDIEYFYNFQIRKSNILYFIMVLYDVPIVH